MTETAIRLRTRVLPGKRIEITAPELNEGEDVELIVLKSQPIAPETRQFPSALDYLNSLPPLHRTPEEWAQVEREIQEEKDSWER